MAKTFEQIPVSNAIRELVDTVEWGVINDYDISTIEWRDEDVAQPSDADINAKRQELADAFNATEYLDLRVNGQYELQDDGTGEMVQVKVADGYPKMEEQLDYIYHNGVDAWKTDMIDPVKTRFPKQE